MTLTLEQLLDFSQINDWKSKMSRAQLMQRNKIMKKIREFFYNRGLVEVETPILSSHPVTDVYLDSFTVNYFGHQYYLNTSPEYHMKRLLACNSGPIFQICKCFRNEETSSKHNPEFTMLEWYRTGYTLQRLLDEVEDFFKEFFDFAMLERYTYDYVFKKYLGFSALEANHSFLVEQASQRGLHNASRFETDAILEFLFSTCIEPYLGQENPVAIYNYPATQAALAQITPGDSRTAQRAEVFYKGIELANGFYELTDVSQQAQRFLQDNHLRETNNQPSFDPDKRFLAALNYGLPPCSGIAVGLDRLIMLIMHADSIDEVMTFNIDNS